MSAIQAFLLILLIPLVLAAAFCSAAETALFSLTHRERARLGRISPASARAAAYLMNEAPSLLVTILLLNNTVNVLYFVLTSVLARGLGRGWIALLASAGSVLALILIGEILPKLLAQRDPARWTRWLVRPLLGMFVALGPVRRLISRGFVAPLTRLVRAEHGASRTIGIDELTELLEVSAREGELESGEEQLLADVVELGSIRVREIMTPRVEMPFLEAADTGEAVAEAVAKSGRTQIPLLSGPEGDVLGIVQAQRLLAARALAHVRGAGADPKPTDFVTGALFVPEMARLDQLLEEFRRAGRAMAISVDEHGTIVGMVTVEDVIRRLVGRGDEGGPGEIAEVQSTGPNSWTVPGGLRLGDLRGLLEDETSEGAPPRSVVTVAGLVFHRLGRVPRVGDFVHVKNLALEVQSMRGRRIERVILTLEDDSIAKAATR
jgi:CBS domain containing-hemolysin-like protein